MQNKLRKVVIIAIISIVCAFPVKVFSQSITFTAQVGDTILILNGFTAPNVLVTFMENNSVIGTTASDSNGAFTKTLVAQDPGQHTFVIYSSGTQSKLSPPLEVNITLIGFQTTEVNDLTLGPSINLNGNNFSSADQISVYGYAKPSTAIAISIVGNSPKMASLATDVLGYYEYNLAANNLTPGDYSVQSFLKDNSDQVIGSSSVLSFSVSPVSSSSSSTSGNISSSTTSTVTSQSTSSETSSTSTSSTTSTTSSNASSQSGETPSAGNNSSLDLLKVLLIACGVFIIPFLLITVFYRIYKH